MMKFNVLQIISGTSEPLQLNDFGCDLNCLILFVRYSILNVIVRLAQFEKTRQSTESATYFFIAVNFEC